MWKYSEIDAYKSISLHDCKTDDIKIEGNELVINFPDGFWITPLSPHNNYDTPVKTGPSQLRFHGFPVDLVIDSVDLFKTTYLFHKPVVCRRIQMEAPDFLKLINDGKHELEFISEYHAPVSVLYQCWIWKKDRGMEAECQLELMAKNIEYLWNEIHHDRKW